MRLEKFENAIIQANAALQLDKGHLKSILRRAKALYYNAMLQQQQATNNGSRCSIDANVLAQATEDLRLIIQQKDGSGVEEAQELMNQITANLNNSDNNDTTRKQ